MKGHTDKSENCKKAGSSSNSKKSKDQKKMGDSKVRHSRKVNSCHSLRPVNPLASKSASAFILILMRMNS